MVVWRSEGGGGWWCGEVREGGVVVWRSEGGCGGVEK